MASRRDNEAERFARIDALMEEYRIKHEDLEAYIHSVRQSSNDSRRESREGITRARAGLAQSRRKRR